MRGEEERLQAKVHGPPQPLHMLRRTHEQRLVARTRVRQAPDAARPQARALSRQQRAWLQVALAPGLGLDCGRSKWTQRQSHVEVFFPLPEHVAPRQARARLWKPCHAAPARLRHARALPCAARAGGTLPCAVHQGVGALTAGRGRWSWS